MTAPEDPSERAARLEHELVRARAELERLGALDPLTGLAVRDRLAAHLDEEWGRALRLNRRTDWPLSLILLDIDFFRALNDRYGSGSGDECLRRVAALLAAVAQRPGDLAVRFGGEEFALLLPGTGADGARTIAQVLRQRIAELEIQTSPPVPPLRFTASFGVATTRPSGGRTPTMLVQTAESALKRAKESGRNRVGWATDAAG